MTVFIVKRLSKKNTEYVALTVNGVIVSFDVMTICRVANCSPLYLDNMRVGSCVDISDGPLVEVPVLSGGPVVSDGIILREGGNI